MTRAEVAEYVLERLIVLGSVIGIIAMLCGWPAS